MTSLTSGYAIAYHCMTTVTKLLHKVYSCIHPYYIAVQSISGTYCSYCTRAAKRLTECSPSIKYNQLRYPIRQR